MKSPLLVELTLTQLCNHKCIHCYNPWRSSIEEAKSSLRTDHLAKIRDELVKHEVFHLTVSGGEPMTQFDLLERTFSLFSEVPISTSLNTNLTLASPERLRRLKQLGLEVILTSLPSSDPDVCDQVLGGRDTLKRIVKGIRASQDADIPVFVNTVISKSNLETLEDTAHFVAELGAKYLSVSIATPPHDKHGDPNYLLPNQDIKRIGDTLIAIREQYGIFTDTTTPLPLCVLGDMARYKDVVRRSCTAGITHMTIGFDGTAYACSHETEGYGNIVTDGLGFVWQAMDGWRRGANLHSQCMKCDFLDLCGGECRMMSESFPDRVYAENPTLHNIEAIQLDEDKFDRPGTQVMIINASVRVRDEDFGKVLNTQRSKNIYLSRSGAKVFEWMQARGSFRIGEVTERFANVPHLTTLLAHLSANNVIIEPSRRRQVAKAFTI